MRELEFILNGMETRRYHGWPVLRQETDAQHQYMVAMFVYLLAGQKEPGIRVPLLMAALTHDLPEWLTGDPPSPMKRALGDEFRKRWSDIEARILRVEGLDFEYMLTPDEKRILKLADYFSGMAYCLRERQMGNQLIDPAWATFISYLPQYLNEPQQVLGEWKPTDQIEAEIYYYLTDKWEQAGGTYAYVPDYYKMIQDGEFSDGSE